MFFSFNFNFNYVISDSTRRSFSRGGGKSLNFSHFKCFIFPTQENRRTNNITNHEKSFECLGRLKKCHTMIIFFRQIIRLGRLLLASAWYSSLQMADNVVFPHFSSNLSFASHSNELFLLRCRLFFRILSVA